MTRLRVTGGAAMVALVLLAGACSSSSDGNAAASKTTTTTAGSETEKPIAPATGKVAEVGTYAVGSHTVTWVDKTRGTNANGKAPALPTRSFKTLVLYPAQGQGTSAGTPVVDAKAKDGPWPLIFFSHGVTGRGSDYALTLQTFASAGYVVVAPNYPLSNRDAPGGATILDEPNQAKGDVPFLLKETLAANKASGFLHGLIDPKEIGLAGHSLGAVTSITAAYDSCCGLPEVKAVAEWAGVLVPLTRPFKLAESATHLPLLIIHGTKDGTVPYASAARVYAAVGTPKLEVTLPGQNHIPAYVIGEGSAPGKVVVGATLAFFDAELKGDAAGLSRVKDVVKTAGPSVATLREDLG